MIKQAVSEPPMTDDIEWHRYLTMAGIRALLKETGYIWTDEERCGGRPCLTGHRFTLHQLLEELAVVYDDGLKGIAKAYELDLGILKGALIEVAQLFDRLPNNTSGANQ